MTGARGRDVEIVLSTGPDLPPAIALAMPLGDGDLEHQAAARARSRELAIARGHLRVAR